MYVQFQIAGGWGDGMAAYRFVLICSSLPVSMLTSWFARTWNVRFLLLILKVINLLFNQTFIRDSNQQLIYGLNKLKPLNAERRAKKNTSKTPLWKLNDFKNFRHLFSIPANNECMDERMNDWCGQEASRVHFKIYDNWKIFFVSSMLSFFVVQFLFSCISTSPCFSQKRRT